ncbi:MAG: response regulator [Acidobacteriia bacterium]|nr:response regulator [Terriglobia bacterium]
MPTHEKTDLPRGSETIMVVEDDDALRELIVGMLQGAGYQVIAAKAPETALDILQASKPAIDVLLTDVIMPKRNGSWLAEKT